MDHPSLIQPKPTLTAVRDTGDLELTEEEVLALVKRGPAWFRRAKKVAGIQPSGKVEGKTKPRAVYRFADIVSMVELAGWQPPTRDQVHQLRSGGGVEDSSGGGVVTQEPAPKPAAEPASTKAVEPTPKPKASTPKAPKTTFEDGVEVHLLDGEKYVRKEVADDLQADVNEYDEVLAEVRTNGDRATLELKATSAQRDAALSRAEEETSKKEALVEKVSGLQGDLRVANSEVERLGKAVTQANSDVEAERRRANQSEHDLAEANGKIKTKDETITEVKTARDDAKARAGELKVSVDELQATVDQYEPNLKRSYKRAQKRAERADSGQSNFVQRMIAREHAGREEAAGGGVDPT